MRPANQALMFAEAERAARYLCVGAAGLALDSTVFLLLSHFGAERGPARACSLAAATCLTWAINRRVTFEHSGRGRRQELARYASVALVAQAANFTLFMTLTAMASALHPVVFIPVCSAVSATISYTGQRLFTFRPARTAP